MHVQVLTEEVCKMVSASFRPHKPHDLSFPPIVQVGPILKF